MLSLFREHKLLDLKLLYQSNNLYFVFLVLILVWAVRRFVNLYVKLVFFKIHYFLMSPYTIGYDQIYSKFYITKIYFFSKKYFSFLRFINSIMTMMLIVFIAKDLLLNNLVLDLSLWYLKYFGVFKFFYICIKFIAKKQDLILDYYAFNITYSYFDTEFWTTLDQNMVSKENHYRFEVIAK